MALEFVSLAEAKAHLRVTHDMDDADIRLKLRAASGAIKNYMGEFSVYEPDRNADDDPLLDSNWEPVVAGETTGTKEVRWEVRAATLILMQKLYDQEYQFDPGHLPPEVTALVYPLRDPALA